MHRGIECGLLVPGVFYNEFLLIGGNMQYGAVNSVNSYDFLNETVHTRPGMKHPRVL